MDCQVWLDCRPNLTQTPYFFLISAAFFIVSVYFTALAHQNWKIFGNVLCRALLHQLLQGQRGNPEDLKFPFVTSYGDILLIILKIHELGVDLAILFSQS